MALLACIPGVALAIRWVRVKLGLRGRSAARLCEHEEHHCLPGGVVDERDETRATP
jgi:hypothetical protein